MGGGTVSAMAMERSENTRGLVLVDGAVFDNNPLFMSKLLYDYYLLKADRFRSFLSSAYGRVPAENELRGYLLPLTQPGTTKLLVEV